MLSLLLAGCYAPAPADGAWACEPGTGACPGGYHCAAGGTCWRDGHDPGAPDGGAPDGGPPSCAGSTAPLCEDFEGGAIDGAIWTTLTARGQVTVDAAHTHRGSHFALHAHTEATTTTDEVFAQLRTQKVFPALQTGFYLRAFLYLPSPLPTAYDTLLWSERAATGVKLALQSGRLAYYEYGTMPDHSLASTMGLPTDGWVCVEWSVGGGASHTYIEGVEVDALHATGVATDALRDLTIGTDLFQATNHPATDLWIDDVLVDDAQIGCAR